MWPKIVRGCDDASAWSKHGDRAESRSHPGGFPLGPCRLRRFSYPFGLWLRRERPGPREPRLPIMASATSSIRRRNSAFSRSTPASRGGMADRACSAASRLARRASRSDTREAARVASVPETRRRARRLSRRSAWAASRAWSVARLAVPSFLDSAREVSRLPFVRRTSASCASRASRSRVRATAFIVPAPIAAMSAARLAFTASTSRSIRRSRTANWARRKSRSAAISPADRGRRASARRRASRPARAFTAGSTRRPSRLATRKPSAKIIAVSITKCCPRPRPGGPAMVWS